MTVYYTTEQVDSSAFLLAALRKNGAEHAQILRTENGKPYLSTGAKFNLTHTAGLTAVAVGGQEVGLDAERRKPRNRDAIMRRLTPEEQQEDFFRLWTAKEAYIKFCGGTLSEMLSDLVYCGGALSYKGAPVNVHLKHFELEGCTLCICMEREEEVAIQALS